MNTKISTKLGTLVLIIIAVTAGAFVWKYEKAKEQDFSEIQNVVIPPKTVSENQVQQEQNVPISQWKTYKNDTYGFEFEYPKNLIVASESTDSKISLSDSPEGHWAYSIIISPNSSNLSLENAFRQKLKEALNSSDRDLADIIVDTTEINIGDKPAKKFSIKNPEDYGNAAVILIAGRNIITIYGDDSFAEGELGFKTILNSLRFEN